MGMGNDDKIRSLSEIGDVYAWVLGSVRLIQETVSKKIIFSSLQPVT